MFPVDFKVKSFEYLNIHVNYSMGESIDVTFTNYFSKSNSHDDNSFQALYHQARLCRYTEGVSIEMFHRNPFDILFYFQTEFLLTV